MIPTQRMRKFISLFLMGLLVCPAFADPCSPEHPCEPLDSPGVEYVVREGDELGEVIHSLSGGAIRLWGKKGAVKRTLKLNPKLSGKADVLIPHTKVLLPIHLPADPAAPSQAQIPAPDAELPTAIAITAPEQTTVQLHKTLSAAFILDAWKLIFTNRNSGAQAKTTSDRSFGLKLKLDHSLSKRFGLGTRIKFLSSKFSSGVQRVQLQQPSLLRVEISEELHFYPVAAAEDRNFIMTLKVGAGYANEFYLRSVTSSSFQLYSKWAPKAYLGAASPILDSEKYLWGTEAQFAALAPINGDGVNIDWGWSGCGQTFLRRKFGSSFLELGLFGEYQRQNSNTFLSERANFGLALGSGIAF